MVSVKTVDIESNKEKAYGGSNSVAWKAYKANAGAKDTPNWALVEQYLPLLKSIVSKMRVHFPSSIDIEDIYSLGIAGLVSSIIRYDPSKSQSFGSYASLRIRGSILDELRKMDWMSRSDRAKAKVIRQVKQELTQNLGRTPLEVEISNNTNIPENEIGRIVDLMQPITMVPLDSSSYSMNGDEEGTVHDMISDLTELDARDYCEKGETVELLREGIKSLPKVQQQVLVLYYYEDLRLAEIAKVLDLTESRICQIHSASIKALKSHLNKVQVL